MNQKKVPLYSQLRKFAANKPLSFHVPGHKNGQVFPVEGQEYYKQILKLDLTELSGLDDLHAPSGVIQEAEQIAAEFFQVDHTFFLVGGSTAGNLAMILATCKTGDKVIVQRNCHKSIMNALELSGAKPIFITPVYDPQAYRFTFPSQGALKQALCKHPDAKAVVLTYPDYFGRTYNLKRMIDLVHEYSMPVLVDEAHGVHFTLGKPFPPSATQLGADVVVQSAHKMAPAMTQSSFLHIKSNFRLKDTIAYYLQMLQSSSPSYPLMASLDLARAYLARMTGKDIMKLMESVKKVREVLQECGCWIVEPFLENNDFLKITLHVKHGYRVKEIVRVLEEEYIFPELITDSQILLIHGLEPIQNINHLEKAVKRASELKNHNFHATIDISKLFTEEIQELALSYQAMSHLTYIEVPFEEGVGNIAAEAVIPYPPGIPIILKGERITQSHIATIKHLIKQGVRIQQRIQGIKIYSNR